MKHCKTRFASFKRTHAVVALALASVSFSAVATDPNTLNFLNAPPGGATDFHIVFSRPFTPGGGVFSSTPFGEPYNLYLLGNTLDYQSVEVQPEGTHFSIPGWALRLHGNVPFPAGSFEVLSYYWTLLNVPVIGSGGGPYAPHTAALVAIPEPETYVLLLAGLGAIGIFVRRSKIKQA